MDLGQLISEIWKWPWYKVLAIAIVDDFLLVVKIWPLYVTLIVLYILYYVFVLRRNKKL